MNTKGVEDGITDEQHYACVMEGVTHAPNGFYAMCHTAGCYWSTHTDCMTKEEAQMAADEHRKNYKPGPRCGRCGQPQNNGWNHNRESGYGEFATVSCSAPSAPVEPPNGLSKVIGTWPGDETDAELLSALDEVRGRAVPVPERTAAPDLVDKWMRIASEKAGQLDDALEVMLDAEDDIFGGHPDDALDKLRRFLAAIRAPKITQTSIPEERTAEIEELMELVQEYRESHTRSRRPCVDSARCSTCRSVDELHLEGQPK